MSTNEPQYESLASLRQDLNSDDRGRMLDAADSVRDAGLSVDEVTSQDPPTEALVGAGIVPPTSSAKPAQSQREEMVDLLRQIEQNTGGSA